MHWCHGIGPMKRKAPKREESSETERANKLVCKENNFLDKFYLLNFIEGLVENLDCIQDIRNLGLAQPAYQDDIANILAREENWNRGVLKNELTSKFSSIQS